MLQFQEKGLYSFSRGRCETPRHELKEGEGFSLLGEMVRFGWRFGGVNTSFYDK